MIDLPEEVHGAIVGRQTVSGESYGERPEQPMMHSVDVCVAELLDKGNDNSAECPRCEHLVELDARETARVLMVTCAVVKVWGSTRAGCSCHATL